MGNTNGHIPDRKKQGNNSRASVWTTPLSTTPLESGDEPVIKSLRRDVCPPPSAEGPLDITTRKSVSLNQNVSGGGIRPRSSTTDSSGPRRQIIRNLVHKSEGLSRKLPTIFKYGGDGKDVYVSGSFNGWKKLRMNKSQKDFVAIVDLHEGDHEYKFFIDGQWVTDSNSPVAYNSLGNSTNRIHVQKEDFNAFDALDMDSAAVLKLQQNKHSQFKNEFSQDIPQAVTFERRSGPPILPPHLLQVILNKDTPLFCEPTLLPEPNHVMLNHLYALSIKEGVMVLSSTQRYRKKCVTTLLYTTMGSRKDD